MNIKSIFKKENIKPVATLSVICLIVALLLGAVNIFTAPIIEEREAAAIRESLKTVMPDGDFKLDTLPADAPETVTAKYTEKNGKGYVVTLVTNEGYTGNDIALTVAISTEGKIIKTVITKNEESITSSGNVNLKPGGSYTEIYNGADKNSIFSVETGATPLLYSKAAIRDALYDAFVVTGFAEPKDTDVKDDADAPLNTPEDELIAISEELLGADKGTLADITPEGFGNVRRVYKHEKLGYAVYITVINEGYNRVENEALVHIGYDGIIKDIRKLTWKTSDAGWGYTPPTQQDADAFYQRLVGVSYYTIDDVDVVTNATNTSGTLIGAIKEGFEAIVAYQNRSIIGWKIMGISVGVIFVLAVALYIAVPKIIKRRREG